MTGERPSVEELRTAADILKRLAKTDGADWTRHTEIAFSSRGLTDRASRIEAEAAAAKAEEQLIEDVARTAYVGRYGRPFDVPWTHVVPQSEWHNVARALLAEFTITRREDK